MIVTQMGVREVSAGKVGMAEDRGQGVKTRQEGFKLDRGQKVER